MRFRFGPNSLSFILRYSGVLGRRVVDGDSGGGTGPRRQPNLGETLGTLRNDASAYRLWVAYRKSRGRPAATNPEELADAESIVIDLCRFTASRFIPINFDEDLQRPPNSKSNRLVTSDVLEKYIGKIIKFFREVHPEHPDWKDLDPNDNKAIPQFWKNLKLGFRKDVQLFHLMYNGDGVIGLEDIRPLYSCLGLDDEGGKYPHRLCDLKHIFIHLIKTANEGGNNNNLQKVAIIHSIAEAIGRGGEAKFQTFRDWYFDFLWNVTNTPWKEKKTVQGYAMGRVADEKWYKDWYFTMGMFALCEDGLYRSPTQKNNGLELVVFPLLYGRKDEGVSTLVTNAIRSALPSDVAKYYSAKSLRQGRICEATHHKDMNYFYLSSVTGHAGDNSSSQVYIDQTDVGRTVPCLNALHGKRDLKTPIAIPTLDALGPADKATAREFMDKVFKCNIPRFMEGGDLHIVKESFLASLLMHHRELMADCTTLNRVSSMLLDKARTCHISCADSPHLPVDKCLEEWSDKIRADYKRQCNVNELAVAAVPTSQQPSYQLMASMAESIKSLTDTVAALNEKFDDMVKKNSTQEATISLLHEKNNALRHQVDDLSMMVAHRSQQLVATPEGGRSRKRQHVGTDGLEFNFEAETAATSALETSPNGSSDTPQDAALPNTAAAAAAAPTANMTAPTTTATNTAVEAPYPTVTNTVVPPPAPPPPVQLLPLRHGHAAEQASKKRSMKKNDFAYHLALLAGRGAFRQHSKLAKGSIPSGYGEKSYVIFCLELVDYVAEGNAEVQANVAIIRAATTDMNAEQQVEVSNAADEIVIECSRQLDEFVPSARATKTTICGMGNRIGDYKNRIKNAKDLPESHKRGSVQLIPLAELQQLEQEKTQRHMGT